MEHGAQKRHQGERGKPKKKLSILQSPTFRSNVRPDGIEHGKTLKSAERGKKEKNALEKL